MVCYKCVKCGCHHLHKDMANECCHNLNKKLIEDNINITQGKVCKY